MKKIVARRFTSIAIALAGIAIVIAIAANVSTARAQEARLFLDQALQQIQTPGAGDVVHVAYTLYERTPPASFEPADAYHRPYKEIWPGNQLLDTWFEIGESGKTIQWRTILRSMQGQVIQDLIFQDGIETDYFPLEFFAERFPQEASVFRDERVALIEDFLENDELTKQDGTDPNGEKVISIYTQAQDLSGTSASTFSVEEALLSFSRPFIADLTPTSRANRIDFSPTTLLPVGTARIVWDAEGNEYIVSYQFFSEPEILSPEAVEGVFEQEVPSEAFTGSYSLPTTACSNGLDDVLHEVSHPLYVLDPNSGFDLASLGICEFDTSAVIPDSLQHVDIADSLGAGVKSIYTGPDNQQLILIQGVRDVLSVLLRQTPPTWTESNPTSVELGDGTYTAWELTGPNAELRLIVEVGETLIYVQSNNLSLLQTQGALRNLLPVDEGEQ